LLRIRCGILAIVEHPDRDFGRGPAARIGNRARPYNMVGDRAPGAAQTQEPLDVIEPRRLTFGSEAVELIAEAQQLTVWCVMAVSR